MIISPSSYELHKVVESDVKKILGKNTMQSEYFIVFSLSVATCRHGNHGMFKFMVFSFSLKFGSHVAKRRGTLRQEMIQSLGWVQPKRGVIEDWKIFMESSMEVASLEKMLISQGGEQARD